MLENESFWRIQKVLEHPVEQQQFSKGAHKRRHKDLRTESANISKVHFFKELEQKSYYWREACGLIHSSLSETFSPAVTM